MLANNLRFTANPRRVLYTAPGTYTFTVPAGYTTLRVTAIGNGGAATDAGGGAGGGIRATISVTPGDTLAVVVPSLGGGDTTVTHNPTSDVLTAEDGGEGIGGIPGVGGSWAATGGWSAINFATGASGVGTTGGAATTVAGLSGGRGGTIGVQSGFGDLGIVRIEWGYT